MVEIKLPPLVERTKIYLYWNSTSLSDLPTSTTFAPPHLARSSSVALLPARKCSRPRNGLGHACMMAEEEAIDVRGLPEALRRELPVKSWRMTRRSR
jgi:hypothetical protein